MRVVNVEDEGFAPGISDAIEQVDWKLPPEALTATIMSSGVPLQLLVDSLALSPIAFARVVPRTAWAFSQNAAFQISSSLRSQSKRRQFLQFLRLVKVVKREASEKVALTWFECHVPHDGKAHVKAQRAKQRARKVGLTIVGAALSQARRVSVSVTDDLAPRKRCVLYFLEVEVAPVLFRYPGGYEEWGVDFKRLLGDRTEELERCRMCSITPALIDLSQFAADPYVDRRNDTVATSKDFEYGWEVQDEIGLSAPIPKLPHSKAQLTAMSNRKEKWIVDYTFAPGRLYQPYRPLGAKWSAWRWAYEPQT